MSRQPTYKFCLYIAGNAQNSSLAVSNLRAICQAHMPDRHAIEIVDVFKEPKRALVEGIFMTPTLIKLAPSPVCRVVGSLSQRRTVEEALGLDPTST